MLIAPAVVPSPRGASGGSLLCLTFGETKLPGWRGREFDELGDKKVLRWRPSQRERTFGE